MKMDKWLYYAFQLSESSKRQLHEYVSTQLSEQLQWMDKIYLDHCTLLHRSQYNNERAVLIKKRLDLLLRTGKPDLPFKSIRLVFHIRLWHLSWWNLRFFLMCVSIRYLISR